MIKEAMEYIQQSSQPLTLTVNEKQYSTVNLRPVLNPEPAALRVSTLTGLIGYIKSRIDPRWQDAAPLILIKNPIELAYLGQIEGDFCQRVTLLEAKACIPEEFPFERYIDPEAFMIYLQTRIDRSGDWQEAVTLCSSIKIDKGAEINDNGVAQEVTVRQGVSLAARKTIKNPIELAPFRTFPEIEQPISKFVLRANEAGHLSLTEADGGAWRLAAMQSIKAYLEEKLKDSEITVLA